MATSFVVSLIAGAGEAVVLLLITGAMFIEVRGHLWVFFIQAEDGRRDYKVTGVQTCALPISCYYYLAGCPPSDPASRSSSTSGKDSSTAAAWRSSPTRPRSTPATPTRRRFSPTSGARGWCACWRRSTGFGARRRTTRASARPATRRPAYPCGASTARDVRRPEIGRAHV